MIKFKLNSFLNKISLLKSHNGFKKYFINTLWFFLEKTLKLFAAIIVGSMVARYLGPEDFGLFSYSQSFVALFLPISMLGLDSIIVRDLLQQNTDKELLLGTAFLLRLIGSFLMIFILILITGIFQIDNLSAVLMLIMASSSLFQSFNIIDFFFQSKVLGRYIVFASLFSLTLSSILKIIFIYFKMQLIYFAYLFVFETVILAIGLLFYYKRVGFSILKWNFGIDKAKYLLSNSWPLILSSIFIMIYMRIDQIMIKHILGSEAVGNYSAAVKLSEAWYMIPVVITSSLFPAIVNSKNTGDQEHYYSRLQKLFRLLIITSITISIPMALFSKQIILLLYGNDYLYSVEVLQVHIWSSIFVFLGVANTKWLINENLQKYSMIYTSIGTVVNIVLNFIFLKKIGITGAAWATLISYALASYFCLLFFKETRVNFFMITRSLLFIK